MKSSHVFGTDIRTSFDAKTLGSALAAPGNDTRYWCSFATVCTVDPESGKPNYADKHAIYNDSAGVDVDVLLEPLKQPCTCKYAGESAGEVTICTPIRPGDIVLVECPDGDLTTPVITHILHTRSKRQPTDGGKPIFDNNRLLIFAKSVPIDIRTAGSDGSPVQILVEQDGTATITAKRINEGDHSVTEQAVLGTSYRNRENAMLDALEDGLSAMESAAQGSNAGFFPGLTMCEQAIATFRKASTANNEDLSNTVYLK